VSIVYAAQVKGKALGGDLAGAEDSRSKATMWMWIGFGCGLVGTILYVAAIAASGGGSYNY